MKRYENVLSLLRKLNRLLSRFMYDCDYTAAWISFYLLCYNLATNNKYILTSLIMFEMFVAIYLLRRIGILLIKLEHIEQSLDGAKIKRIELEVTPKE